MHSQQDTPVQTGFASTPHGLADDNKWNRDLAFALKTLRSLDSRQICQRCQDIFEVVNQHPGLYRGLHRVDPSLDNTACGLCNAIKCTEKRRDVQFSRYNSDTGETESERLILEMKHQGAYPDGKSIIFRTHPLWLDRPWFDPWPRDPSKVDLQHLKVSLAYCKSNHDGDVCKPRRMPINGLWLFNCTTRVIERATADSEYVALSYVWGTTISDNCSRSASQSEYDLTIEDAIFTTLNFGYTYLWVDQLCIDQGGSHMEDQIRQMDLIYLNADLTIFATAGEGSSHGLPGVTTTSRSPRMSFRNGNTIYYEIKRTPQRIIEDSKWDTRAWTFQEWVFSRRRLVFSETEAFFVCNTLIANEERGSECAPYSALFDRHLEPPHRLISHLWHGFPTSIQTANSTSPEVIAKYASRSLKYSSDGLNAIEGVFRAFQRLTLPTYNFWGIPVLRSTSYTEREQHRTDIPPFDGFINGLCWREGQTEQTAVRESKFPSWTWAGWKCIRPASRRLLWSFVNQEISLSQAMRGCTVAKISIELLDESRISWRELAKRSFLQNEPHLKTPFIWLEAPTIDVYVQWETAWERPKVLIKIEGEAPGGLPKRTYRANVNRCQEDGAYFPGMHEQKLTGIILWNIGSEAAALDKIAYVLVVKEKELWAERVGSIQGYLSEIEGDPRFVKVKWRWLRLG